MSENQPPLIRSNVAFFGLFNLVALVAVPVWGLTQGFSGWVWPVAMAMMAIGGLGITAGYHRLWSHRTYQARWPLRLALAIGGALALQNSIYIWAARHRIHHRFVDDVERDPHSIKRGFWHAHIGWMLRDWPTSEPDFSQVRDLEKDPIVMWQHKYYWTLVWASNLGIPLVAGWLAGDIVGMLLVAGFLRLALSHHFTFFINSLAHIWGRQTYSDDCTAVDNGLIALFTWGEGYHNYHHAFQGDYRNGLRWWQWDPGKWLINLCAWTGLAYGRRRTPAFKIQRARLHLQFRRLQQQAESGEIQETWRELLEREYQQFRNTVQEWQQVQARKVAAGRDALRDRWLKTEFRTSFKELEFRLKMQRRRLRALTALARPSTA